MKVLAFANDPHSVLYLRHDSARARPKPLSGRTSYYQARLAFHFYPQLIQWYCTANWFGPPVAFLRRSSWPWVARLVSGLFRTTCYATANLQPRAHKVLKAEAGNCKAMPYSDSVSLRLPPVNGVRQAVRTNSLDHSAKGTP